MNRQLKSSNVLRTGDEYELQRLHILKSCRIMDTPPEDCFDSLVHLVQESFQTPVALITLLDDKRLWFKAKAGVDIKQVPRKASICAHTILYNNVTVVHDLKDDKRFHNNPLLDPPYNVRFYAGAPIIMEGGYKIGTVCVLDNKPRHEFSGLDAIRLAEYAGVVGDLIAMRKKVSVETQNNNAKSEFLHELSHEIKTPLNVISGISKILIDSTDIKAEKAKLIQVMNQSANSLTDLMEKINDIELINNRKLSLVKSRFNLFNCVSEVQNIISVLTENKGIDFKTDFKDIKNVTVYTDKLRLKQVLMNVLGNAVKYTNEGEIQFNVKILSSSAHSKPVIHFGIKDTGLGIHQKDQEKVFNRFVRASHRVHHRDGAGLGLTITKKIVDEMGGVIDFESTPDKGSYFWVEFPKESLKMAEKH